MGLDLSDTRTRVLTATVGAGLGVVATSLTGGTAAVAAFGGSLFGGLLMSDLYHSCCKRLGPPNDLLRNHDLAKLTAHAIRQAIEELAGDMTQTLSSSQRTLLKKLAKQVERQWTGLLGDAIWGEVIEDVSEAKLPGFFQGLEPGAGDMRALTPSIWTDLLKHVGRQADVGQMYDPVLDLAGDHLHKRFAAAIWGLIKADATGKGPTDGKAFAALHLTMLGEILERLPTEVQRLQDREED